MRDLLSAGAYDPFIQDLVAPAQYWHDSTNLTNFVHGSHYLALVNNEREEKEPLYRDRMIQLDNFVMMRWEAEATVIPAESRCCPPPSLPPSPFYHSYSHFGFYAPGDVDTILPLQESQLYKDDLIGDC